MITAMFRYRVRKGFEAQVRDALIALPAFLHQVPGFCELELLSEPEQPSALLLLIRWITQDAFDHWQNQSSMPLLRSLPKFTGVTDDQIDWENSSYSLPAVQTYPRNSEPLTFHGALLGISAALSHWLSETDTVVALLINRDGTILIRNRASKRIFPVPPSRPFSDTIWDYLIFSDVESLRSHIAKPEQAPSSLILNIDHGEKSPLSVELGLIDCGDEFLLLGGPEQRHSQDLPDEFQALTNKLSVMARELSRKNKELMRSNLAIQRLAQTDMLTRLANRDLFYLRLEQEIARSRRQSEPLTLIMADLDDFKMINDQCGHVVGDHVLAETGRILAGRSRPYDLAARYGGDECALLLPKTDIGGGLIVAERIREDIQAMQCPECPDRIRMSLGLATLEQLESAEGFVTRADAALYSSKAAGGNLVSTNPLHSQGPSA